MKNRCSPEHQALIRRTIYELGERLPGEDLRLTDVLRLLDLREELDEDGIGPMKAGWVRCRR